MTDSRPWFDLGSMRGHYEPSSIITTDDGTRWEILERLKQENFQIEAQTPSAPSYATLKLRCVKANVKPSERSGSEAFMRIYLQIPHVWTEQEHPNTRAAQADPTFQPDELDTYSTLSKHRTVSKFTPKLLGSKMSVQEPSGFVPGGFLTVLVWEKVAGLPLGDRTGKATGYWNLPPRERAKIRQHFETTFKQISSTVGIWPRPISAHHLVWDSMTETLFWVGFRVSSRKKGKPWTEAWLPAWALVKTPPQNLWTRLDWNGDTTDWQY